MKRFRNILVVAGGPDGGRAALRRAAELARTNGGRVTLAYVLESFSLLGVRGYPEAESMQDLTQHRLAWLDEMVQPYREKNANVHCKLLHGSAADEIIKLIASEGHDLLIKMAEEPAGITQRLFGTTGLRLMRRCPCPVWIIKTSLQHRFHRILAAVDPKPFDKKADQLNIKILDIAASIAEIDNSELHVVYVWPEWTDWARSTSPDDDMTTEQSDLRREMDALQGKLLSRITAPYRISRQIDSVHLLKGNPGEKITRLAEELKIELLVMGTVCRSGVAGFFIGNTAERVLDQVNCSILAVKPSKFDTAVKVEYQVAEADVSAMFGGLPTWVAPLPKLN
jgi:universal stress protein E